jgi:tetratricopeptide (TPR) repeat protein
MEPVTSPEPDELDDDLYAEILRFCALGDGLSETGLYREAIERYNDAWHLVPEPKTHWNASTWVLAAIADSSFLGGFIDLAREVLDDAMHCPGAIGNPFLHLRRGEVLYEQGELDAAADELIRAYMSEGAEIFEDEDPKYLRFLATRARL